MTSPLEACRCLQDLVREAGHPAGPFRSLADARLAYRRIAKAFHPDRLPTSTQTEGAQKMASAAEAIETLERYGGSWPVPESMLPKSEPVSVLNDTDPTSREAGEALDSFSEADAVAAMESLLAAFMLRPRRRRQAAARLAPTAFPPMADPAVILEALMGSLVSQAGFGSSAAKAEPTLLPENLPTAAHQFLVEQREFARFCGVTKGYKADTIMGRSRGPDGSVGPAGHFHAQLDGGLLLVQGVPHTIEIASRRSI